MGSLEETPLAVKILENRLFIHPTKYITSYCTIRTVFFQPDIGLTTLKLTHNFTTLGKGPIDRTLQFGKSQNHGHRRKSQIPGKVTFYRKRVDGKFRIDLSLTLYLSLSLNWIRYNFLK